MHAFSRSLSSVPARMYVCCCVCMYVGKCHDVGHESIASEKVYFQAVPRSPSGSGLKRIDKQASNSN